MSTVLSQCAAVSAGSGIGLHVARAVVDLHGGEIGIDSAPGHGTAVHVVVPLASTLS